MIFKPAARYPADPRAVFILGLSVFSGITALALDVAPSSLEAHIPYWAVVVWGTLLTLGSMTTLFGMWRQTVGGIIIEQIGSVMIAATTIFYVGIALTDPRQEPTQPLIIVLAWGLSCLVRWLQLQVLINNSSARAKKLIFLQKFEADLAARRHVESKRQSQRLFDSEHTDWRHS